MLTSRFKGVATTVEHKIPCFTRSLKAIKRIFQENSWKITLCYGSRDKVSIFGSWNTKNKHNSLKWANRQKTAVSIVSQSWISHQHRLNPKMEENEHTTYLKAEYWGGGGKSEHNLRRFADVASRKCGNKRIRSNKSGSGNEIWSNRW